MNKVCMVVASIMLIGLQINIHAASNALALLEHELSQLATHAAALKKEEADKSALPQSFSESEPLYIGSDTTERRVAVLSYSPQGNKVAVVIEEYNVDRAENWTFNEHILEVYEKDTDNRWQVVNHNPFHYQLGEERCYPAFNRLLDSPPAIAWMNESQHIASFQSVSPQTYLPSTIIFWSLSASVPHTAYKLPKETDIRGTTRYLNHPYTLFSSNTEIVALSHTKNGTLTTPCIASMKVTVSSSSTIFYLQPILESLESFIRASRVTTVCSLNRADEVLLYTFLEDGSLVLTHNNQARNIDSAAKDKSLTNVSCAATLLVETENKESSLYKNVHFIATNDGPKNNARILYVVEDMQKAKNKDPLFWRAAAGKNFPYFTQIQWITPVVKHNFETPLQARCAILSGLTAHSIDIYTLTITKDKQASFTYSTVLDQKIKIDKDFKGEKYNYIQRFTISPDGKTIIAALSDKTVCVCNLATAL